MDALSELRILHIAPEPHISRVIAAACPPLYVKGDLFPQGSDVQRVDVEEMPFEDESFDLVLANHVLEHVAEDLRATSEIWRVLRPGGSAILQTPFSAVLQRTWEDPGIVDPHARLNAFGQEDHVRLFGLDIFDRIAAAGLEPRIANHSDLFPRGSAFASGVNEHEPFFLFRRGSDAISSS